jgi:hypothetical protein
LAKKAQSAPYRKADLNNLPLQEAQHRFIEQLAKHRPLRRMLFGWPLRRWKALSDAARDECQLHRWVMVRSCRVYNDLLPETLANNPVLQEEQRVHLEMIPLCDSLNAFARKFGLMYNAEPAIWAMDILLDDLHQKAMRPRAKGPRQWRITEMFQAYPARTEQGWISASTGLPEEELFMIVIEIRPKQPDETFDAFARRFDRTCAKERERYIRELKAAEWIKVRRSEKLSWIDRLAKWQAGLRQTEIDPSIKTVSQRAAFTQGIKRAAKDIGISPRKSKHDPRRRPEH